MDTPMAKYAVPDDIRTVDEMVRTLSRDRQALEAATEAWTAARDRYAYLTQVGIYNSPQAHEASFAEHLPDLEAAEQHLAAVAGGVEARAREIMRVAQSSRLVLPPGTAPAVADVAHLTETLELPALAAAMRDAFVAADVAELYLWATYLPARLDRPLEDRDRMRPEVGRARDDLRRMLTQVRQSLRDRSLDHLKDSAVQSLSRADAAKVAASRRRRAAAPLLTADGLHPKVPWPDR